jgi:hypothetical protein
VMVEKTRRVLSIGLVAVISSIPAAAHAHIDGAVEQPGALVEENCTEMFAVPVIDGDVADELVPAGYDLAADPDGRYRVFVSTRRCDSVRVGDVKARDVIESHISVPVIPRGQPAPHRSFVFSPDSPAPLEVYLLQWISNKKIVAQWLKQNTGLGDRVKVVPDLTYEYHPVPGTGTPGASDDSFFLQVPAPASSPFTINASVTEGSPPYWDTAENWWADTDEGTVIIHVDQPRGASMVAGTAYATITSDDPDSPLGDLMGEQQTQTLVAPGADVLFNTVGHLHWTKCVRTAANPCSPQDH